MAFYDTADALYGTGTYGSARYGRVTPVVQVTGVSATANTRTIHLNVFEVDISEPIYNAQGATGSVGSLTLNTAAGLSGVAGTSAVGTLTPNVDKPIDSVFATGSVNTVTVNVQESVTGVVGTTTLDTAGLVVKSVNTVEVIGFGLTGSIGTVEAQTLEALQSVSATGSIGTLKPNVTDVLTGIQGSVSVTAVTAKNDSKIVAQGVLSTGQIGDIGGAPTEEIDSVEATASVNPNGVKVNVTEIIPSSNFPLIEGNTLGATISVNFVPQTEAELAASNAANQGESVHIKIIAEKFDFEAVKNQYSRRRTVVLPRAA